MDNADYKAMRQGFDLRWKIPEDMNVARERTDMYKCPFHDDKTPSFKVYEQRYQCYSASCGATGDVMDWLAFWNKKPISEVYKDLTIEDKQAQAERKQAYLEAQAARIESDLKELQRQLQALREERAWERYHQEMTDADRQVWNYRGVPDWYQKFMYLGATTQTWHFEDQQFSSRSLTIPMFDNGRDVHAIKHRLLEHPQGAGKYRATPHHVSPPLYVANPDGDMDIVYLCEGEIKAMVFFATLGSSKAYVVGSPSARLTDAHFKQLEPASKIVYIPDPGVDREIQGSVWRGLKDKDFYRLPLLDKVDDLIIEAKMDKNTLRGLIRNARKV